jgi:hypothetical protein
MVFKLAIRWLSNANCLALVIEQNLVQQLIGLGLLVGIGLGRFSLVGGLVLLDRDLVGLPIGHALIRDRGRTSDEGSGVIRHPSQLHETSAHAKVVEGNMKVYRLLPTRGIHIVAQADYIVVGPSSQLDVSDILSWQETGRIGRIMPSGALKGKPVRHVVLKVSFL